MKYLKLSKDIVNLRILVEGISENHFSNDLTKVLPLSMRIKSLFLISKNKDCAPSFLIEKLGMAKSNLALLCKGLIKEGLILSGKNQTDKRNIFYNITKQGEDELESYFNLFEKNLEQSINKKDIKLVERKIEELTNLLTKIFQNTKKKN